MPPAILAGHIAQIAQLVEQRIENPRVGGSIPSLGTMYEEKAAVSAAFVVSRTEAESAVDGWFTALLFSP
jgi:hypothetical protein